MKASPDELERRAMAHTHATATDWRSLFLVRPRKPGPAALVVATLSQEALDTVNAAIIDGEAWDFSDCTFAAVQRNVDMPRGFFAWVPRRSHEGQHRAHTSDSRKRKRARRQSARRRREKEAGDAA